MGQQIDKKFLIYIVQFFIYQFTYKYYVSHTGPVLSTVESKTNKQQQKKTHNLSLYPERSYTW